MQMVKNDREYRNMTMHIREAQEGEEDQSKVVTGYASTFDEPYKLFSGEGWEYWETVDRNAFDETDMADVIMQYDHHGRVFARTRNNTLSVKPDEKGLFIEADLGGTEIGRELYEEIAGGYTDRMSFGFTVTGETEGREKNENGIVIYTRHITKVGKLYDVSAVSIPANDGTSISADAVTRSIGDLNDGVIARIQAERLEEEKAKLEQRRAEVKARALGGNN
jgi:HK97 family phage prohead protease